LGYCHLRKDYRQFRLDRIHGISRSEKPFVRTHGTVDEYRKKNEPDKKTKVRISVDKKIVKYLKYDRHFYGFVSEVNKGDQVEMTFMTRSLEEGFSRWFLMFGDYAQILEPQSLKDRVKEILLKTMKHL
jgi:predicted DNA-binding transcriptional regulator YafY